MDEIHIILVSHVLIKELLLVFQFFFNLFNKRKKILILTWLLGNIKGHNEVKKKNPSEVYPFFFYHKLKMIVFHHITTTFNLNYIYLFVLIPKHN
jgi:hypothetical protein